MTRQKIISCIERVISMLCKKSEDLYDRGKYYGYADCLQLIKQLPVLEPYSIVVINGEGNPVRVGEIPELEADGSCGLSCSFRYNDIVTSKCNFAKVIRGDPSLYPGVNCPRGEKK